MGVTKRVRFEILRRDGFTCRYCGSSAPDVKLAVDHVTPTALGGTDDPSNLVTACVDCNAGKASTAVDSVLVGAVADDAERWAAAIREVARQQQAVAEEAAARVEPFRAAWLSWDAEGTYLPGDWRPTIEGWLASGLTVDEAIQALSLAVANRGVRDDGVFAYTCGIVRNKIKALHEAARALLERGGA
jgi:hypothetical protein